MKWRNRFLPPPIPNEGVLSSLVSLHCGQTWLVCTNPTNGKGISSFIYTAGLVWTEVWKVEESSCETCILYSVAYWALWWGFSVKDWMHSLLRVQSNISSKEEVLRRISCSLWGMQFCTSLEKNHLTMTWPTTIHHLVFMVWSRGCNTLWEVAFTTFSCP